MAGQKHSHAVVLLLTEFVSAVEFNKLGKVYVSLEVAPPGESEQATSDICVVLKDNPAEFNEAGILVGTPDLVVEVVSAETYEDDASFKKTFYERIGVPEYWAVLPEFKIMIILAQEGPSGFRTVASATAGQKIASQLIPGLEVEVDRVLTV